MSCGPSFRTLFTARETSYCSSPAATASDSWSSSASRSSEPRPPSEPVVVAVRGEERRHPVVHLARGDVGVPRDDRQRQQPLVRVVLGLGRVGPGAHDARHRERTRRLVHEVGFLAVLADDPLVVAERRDDAPVRREARPNMPLVATVSMRALIGFGRCFRKSFAAARHEAPADLRELALPVALPDRVHGVGRGDVPARGEAGVDLAVSSSTCSVRAASSPTSSGSRSAWCRRRRTFHTCAQCARRGRQARTCSSRCPLEPVGSTRSRPDPNGREKASGPGTRGEVRLRRLPEERRGHYAVAQDIIVLLSTGRRVIEQVAGSGGLRVDPPRVRLHRDRGRLDLDEPEPRRRRCQLRRRVVVPRVCPPVRSVSASVSQRSS